MSRMRTSPQSPNTRLWKGLGIWKNPRVRERPIDLPRMLGVALLSNANSDAASGCA
jgi:hypothetical protein